MPAVVKTIAAIMNADSGSSSKIAAATAAVAGTDAVIIVVSDAPSNETARVNKSIEMTMLSKP